MNENLFFWFCALTWLFSVTLCACKYGEWDRCREQGDEFTRHDIKGHPTQLQTERLRCTDGPQGLDRGRGEWVKERERNCINFCPWSVKGLNKCVGALNWGCRIKCLVVWWWFLWAFMAFFHTSLNLACVYACLSLKVYSIKACSLFPPKPFHILTVRQSTNAWMYFWTNLLESKLNFWSNIYKKKCVICLMITA